MNSEQQEEHQTDVGKVSIGKRLKSAREAQGLSVKDVADNLRLRVSVIEEIEEDKSTQISAYTRGYIRGYAKLLGIDPESLLKGSVLTIQVLPDRPMQSFSGKARQRKKDNQLMTLTWAILTLAVGVTIIWWWQSSQRQMDETREIASTINVEKGSSSNAQDITSVKPPSHLQSDVINENKAKEPPQVAKPKPIIAQTPNSADNSQIPKLVNNNALVMNFIADCWVDIKDGSGKRLLTGIKSRGESVELMGEEPFKIVLGAPSAVELTYKGEEIDLSGYSPKRVARLTLPQK